MEAAPPRPRRSSRPRVDKIPFRDIIVLERAENAVQDREKEILAMWVQQNLDDYDRQFKWYQKKRRKELEATLENLDRFYQSLRLGGRLPDVVKAFRFLHPEQAGVIAVDQRGSARNLIETRLYTYPDETTRTLFLITIGDKNTQSDDVQFSKEFVGAHRKAQTHGQERAIDPPDG